MKWNDRNIDQLFRDAAQNTPAPGYKSSYWNDISSALNAEQRRKRGLILWSLGGGTVLVALFAILFYEPTFQVDKPRYAQQQGAEITPVEYSSTEKSLQTTTHLSVPKEQQETSVSTHLNSSDSETKKNSSAAGIESNGASQAEHTVSADNYSKNSKKRPDIVHIDNRTTENQNSLTSHNADSEENKTKLEEVNDGEFTASIDILSVRELNFTPFNNSEDLLIASNQRKWNLSAQVNLGAMENYKTSRPFESGIMSFALKGNYLKSNLQISSGIGIQVSTNSDLVVSQRAKYYGFGVVNHQTDISYQNMYDLFIPVELGYRHNNTTFGIGLQANYLINTSMQLRKYEDNLLVSSENISGYSNGLNKLSAQGYLWVSQQFSPRFSAGLKIGTSFTNRIKEGNYFNESATTNPIFGQISLGYKIFK